MRLRLSSRGTYPDKRPTMSNPSKLLFQFSFDSVQLFRRWASNLRSKFLLLTVKVIVLVSRRSIQIGHGSSGRRREALEHWATSRRGLVCRRTGGCGGQDEGASPEAAPRVGLCATGCRAGQVGQPWTSRFQGTMTAIHTTVSPHVCFLWGRDLHS